MNEEPEIPVAPSRIPRGRLCLTLCIPPALALLAGLFLAAIRRNNAYGYGALGLSVIWVTVLGVLVIHAGMTLFHGLIGARYEGRSRILLCFFYFVAQLVVGLLLFLGTCFLMIRL